jgi:flagellar basal-body rod modification protein FlgD
MAGINPLSYYSTNAASAAQSSAAEKKTDSSSTFGSGTVDKTEFLKLLVVQLQNQDPLSPIKNENFVAQMATFSSLEQLISINQAVSKLAETDQTNAAGQTEQQKRA